MAVTYTYVQTCFLVRDETDTGYYVFITTAKSNALSTTTGFYSVHTADTDGYVKVEYGELKIDIYSLFSSYIDGVVGSNKTSDALVVY